jgi:hypothetical protein
LRSEKKLSWTVIVQRTLRGCAHEKDESPLWDHATENRWRDAFAAPLPAWPRGIYVSPQKKNPTGD